MKKILVPTDFSSAAKNAAHYAMHLAKEMKVDVKLCNAILVPAEAPMAERVAWPLADYSTLKSESEVELRSLVENMKALFELESPTDFYHPRIEAVTDVGWVKDVVTNLAHHQDISLVVMGMSGATGPEKFLMGGNSRALIEAAAFPILLIPKEARFKKIEKIAFATDLGDGDVEMIHLLAGFARIFDAEILLIHISDSSADHQPKDQPAIDIFLNEITNKVNYHKIYYEYVWNVDVDRGLDWLIAQGKISILAMVHRNKSLFSRIFKGSHTQRIKNKIDIPLLVLPESLHRNF
ncbi:universal stress protein [Pedobacter sp. FW305-3-2-15-E-R2A2]|uniref:universal stress protein n=1 Tax=Pedobacter sp. FW305-3-2-15-E-R2A2 TaxID=3140251 RepID=UPI0031408734